jgi:hypothetical protein
MINAEARTHSRKSVVMMRSIGSFGRRSQALKIIPIGHTNKWLHRKKTQKEAVNLKIADIYFSTLG